LAAVFLLLLGACSQAGSGVTGEDVLFQDQFVAGQMGPWVLEGDALGRSSVINEQLLLDLNASNIMQFVTLPQPTFQDFVLEVEARPLVGDPANSYGVLFRMQDTSRFYRFELTGYGAYMFERHNADGTWTRFVDDWTSHPAIQPGQNAVNRIRIEAIGPSLTAYVNDTLVQQVNDATYAAGQIALDAGTFGDPTMQVAFDNVIIRQP
jgi:hypothetical protein